MAIVFVSYRRDDSADVTGRIYDDLLKHFKSHDVFMDVDSVPDGADFVKIIQDNVRECQVMLVVIGPNWVGRLPGTEKCRIQDPDDFVRLEVESALRRGMPIMPLLVARSSMPDVTMLPGSLHPLTRLNARQVRANPEFHTDMEKVIIGVERLRADWFAAEERRKLLARQPDNEISPVVIAGVDPAFRLQQLVLLAEAATRYGISAFRAIIWQTIAWMWGAALLAAAGTIGVAILLLQRFPPGELTYAAALWSALTTGAFAAMWNLTTGFIREIIKAIELIIWESEQARKETALRARITIPTVVTLPPLTRPGASDRSGT